VPGRPGTLRTRREHFRDGVQVEPQPSGFTGRYRSSSASAAIQVSAASTKGDCIVRTYSAAPVSGTHWPDGRDRRAVGAGTLASGKVMLYAACLNSLNVLDEGEDVK
jgi:hypothetical protein